MVYIRAGCGRVDRFGCVTCAFSLKLLTRLQISKRREESSSERKQKEKLLFVITQQ